MVPSGSRGAVQSQECGGISICQIPMQYQPMAPRGNHDPCCFAIHMSILLGSHLLPSVVPVKYSGSPYNHGACNGFSTQKALGSVAECKREFFPSLTVNGVEADMAMLISARRKPSLFPLCIGPHHDNVGKAISLK